MLQSDYAGAYKFELKGEELLLLPEKAIFWRKRKSLLIADLHIGKVTHFRKNNIAIPSQAAEENFDNLEHLLLRYKPEKVYFLGDLFHSYYNLEWDKLSFLLAKYRKIRFILITGNHDILQEEHYTQAGLECHHKYDLSPFILTHHPEETEEGYNLCGHLHPGIKLRGEGRQFMKLPCFYFGTKGGILPAFGNFTGSAAINVKKGDDVIVVFNDRLMKIEIGKKE